MASKKKKPAVKKKTAKRAAPKKKKSPKKAAPRKAAAKKAAAKKAAPTRKAAARPSVKQEDASLAQTLKAAAVEPEEPANLTARHAPVDDFTSSGNELVDIFQRYDRDRTGFIERTEFARLLEAMGQNPGEEELAIALDVVDPMRTGKVSYQDFRRWWTAR